MSVILAIDLFLILFIVIIYVIYYVVILGSKSKINMYLEEISNILQTSPMELPDVSIIISAFEEDEVIRRKLKNISDLNYPQDKIEVIVIDDASRDNTYNFAKKAFEDYNLNGDVLKNSDRIGLNASLNLSMNVASNEILCITDADVTLEENALRNAVLVLTNMKNVGGITGNIISTFNEANQLSRIEDNYRVLSNKSMLVESFLHSTFPGSGVLMVFKKSALRGPIPVEYGSTDGNISMKIIENDHRFVYVPSADVFEGMPHELEEHRTQKIRRARRLIQVLLHNIGMLFNKKYSAFGSLVLPLKFAMYVVCPVFISLSVILTLGYVLMLQNMTLTLFFVFLSFVFLMVILLSNQIGLLLSGFFLHQMYLLIGLLTSSRKTLFWKKIQRKH